MAKEERRPRSILPYVSYADDLINLACDQIEIEHLDRDVPKNFVVRTLIDYGRIGFLDRNDPSRGFYRMDISGLPDRYGLFHHFYYYTYDNGFYVSYDEGGREIRANATGIPPRFAFDRAAVLLDMADRSIAANIRAQIYGRAISTGTDKERDKIDVLLDRVESGKPLVVTEDLANVLRSSLDLSVPVTFDKMLLARSAIWSAIVKRVGSVAADQYKKERVQSAEVDAAIGETIDNVYIMINAFNEATEREEIRGEDGEILVMKYTGYAARFDDMIDEPIEPEPEPEPAGEGGAEE